MRYVAEEQNDHKIVIASGMARASHTSPEIEAPTTQSVSTRGSPRGRIIVKAFLRKWRKRFKPAGNDTTSFELEKIDGCTKAKRHSLSTATRMR